MDYQKPKSSVGKFEALVNSSLNASKTFWSNPIDLETCDRGVPRQNSTLFVTLGCVLAIIAIIGIAANILSIIVFSRMTHKSTTTFLMQMLAFADSMFLLANITMFSIMSWFTEFGHTCTYLLLFSNALPYLSGFLEIFRDFAVWLVPVVTMERYLAIYYPLKMSTFCRFAVAWKVILGIFLYSVFLNIPSFLAYTRETTKDINIGGKNVRLFSMSALTVNPIYNTTYFIVDSILNVLIPVGLVCSMNFRIIIVLNRARKRTQKRNEFQRGQGEPDRGSFATVMLVTIAIIFVLCEMPKVVDIGFMINRKWKRTSSRTMSEANNEWFTIFIVSTLSQAFNSFINFFVYCLTGRRFRRVLRSTLSLTACRKRLCPHKEAIPV